MRELATSEGVAMQLTWSERKSWVAVFDILGFRAQLESAVRDVPRDVLLSQLDDLIGSLDSDAKRHGNLQSMVFSDTIVVFAPSSAPQSYPWFLQQCKALITRSITIQLPLRGAISVGTTHTAAEHPVILGQPFLEAFAHCEAQDWIGLLLTPTATQALRAAGLEPLRHDFVAGSIPLRKVPSEDVMAYRFQNGSANFANPLLHQLRDMRARAPDDAKPKYDRTIVHIEAHHRWLSGQQADAAGRPQAAGS